MFARSKIRIDDIFQDFGNPFWIDERNDFINLKCLTSLLSGLIVMIWNWPNFDGATFFQKQLKSWKVFIQSENRLLIILKDIQCQICCKENIIVQQKGARSIWLLGKNHAMILPKNQSFISIIYQWFKFRSDHLL